MHEMVPAETPTCTMVMKTAGTTHELKVCEPQPYRPMNECRWIHVRHDAYVRPFWLALNGCQHSSGSVSGAPHEFEFRF